MTLESLARTIAKGRHGTDDYWANYLPSARAVVEMFSRELDRKAEEWDEGSLGYFGEQLRALLAPPA